MFKATGGNLSQPVRRFLINTMTAADFGLYTDTVTGYKNLVLKKLGYTLPSLSGGTNVNITKHCTSAGQLKVVAVDFDNECPCSECGWDYGIFVILKHKTPGYFNDFIHESHKNYSGSINKLNCVSGEIPAAKISTAKDDIINQINADIGFMNTYAGANVIAGRAYKVSAYNANDTVTINGTGYTSATIGGLVTAINAGTDAYAFLDTAAPTTTIWVVANATPTTFTVTSANMTVSTNWYIGIISKSVDWDFEVEIQHLDATGTVTVAQTSKFPFLTSDDVFRLFPAASAAGSVRHDGNLVTQMYNTSAIDGAEYCKYTLQVEHDINSLDAASHYEHYVGTIEIYVKNTAANITTNIWDATNYMWNGTSDNAGFAADKTFTELLAAWIA